MVSSVKSREETRFLALLKKTHERASNLGQKKTVRIEKSEKSIEIEQTDQDIEDEVDWRLPKFIDTLEKWLEELKHHPQGPEKDVLKEYHTRVDFLRKVLTTYNNERLISATSDKPTIVEGPSPGSRRNSSSKMESEARKRSFREASPMVTNTGPSSASHFAIPHGPASTRDTISKEIHQRITSRQDLQTREALFGDSNESGVRKRRGGNFLDLPEDDNDLDSLMKAHHAAQEQTAEEMLSLTRTLKEHAQAANTIIKKDTEILEKTNDLADRNTSRLGVESDRLSEARSQFSCRCWIWLLIGTVSISFITMVWVMKLFRKRKDME